LAEARQLIKTGKYADAIQRLNQLQTSSSQIRGIHHELGIANYRQGDFLVAQSEFAKAIEEDANDREAVQLRGIALYQIGRPAEAIPLLKQVQSWAPEAGVESSYVLALAYLQTRDYESVRREAARMYAVPEDSPASYLFAARMMLRQGHDPVAQQF